MFKEKITVSGSVLDKYQMKVIKSNANNLLVLAGAGSGKTLTIVGKVKYLLKNNVKEDEILCISFTKKASLSLKRKLEKENIYLDVKTFHSLGYSIIKEENKYNLVEDNVLDQIIDKHLKQNKYLAMIINEPFIKLGKGNFKRLENNIIYHTKHKEKIQTTIKTFINLFKGNNFNINEFKCFHEINNKERVGYHKKRHTEFLKLTKQIIIDYQKTLKQNGLIDFHDMINMATQIVNVKGIKKYKYIIIDEYQDTSLSKCDLIKAIKEKTNAKLIAVGDDWQSIYRFTGSNLSVFTQFKKHFKQAKIIKLKKTYRNSKELLKITTKFIKKNPHQLSKKLLSDKENKEPIQIYYYTNKINEVWPKIVKKIGCKPCLVLGRNNKDKLKVPYLKDNMNFMTVHASKGLESDNVIILNLENKITGFPSQIKTDEFLKYLIKDNEIKYSEERRLFYVALTRTKNNNYLIVKKDNPSIFVKELINYKNKNIVIKNN